MSKLTDKIAAELTRPHSDRHLATLQDILADVRELEKQTTAWTTQQRYVAIARQAKREAYEHAQHLVQYKDSSPWQAIQNAKARKAAGGQWHCAEHGENDI